MQCALVWNRGTPSIAPYCIQGDRRLAFDPAPPDLCTLQRLRTNRPSFARGRCLFIGSRRRYCHRRSDCCPLSTSTSMPGCRQGLAVDADHTLGCTIWHFSSYRSNPGWLHARPARWLAFLIAARLRCHSRQAARLFAPSISPNLVLR